ncbi:MAG TPA: GntR family transcriptional regulator [Sphingomicrobium sp.]
MSRPGTFERVYAAIKSQLREGIFRPGERLEPAMLAEQLYSSATPVRDALHRLAGERLVETPRHEGFRAPVLTETTLRHLYAWHRDLLLLSLVRRGAGTLAALSQAEELAEGELHGRRNEMFLALAASGGNPEHVQAFASLLERIEPIQRLEEKFLDALETEIAQIAEAIRTGNRAALRRGLVQYHRRRERIVPELLAGLYERAA